MNEPHVYLGLGSNLGDRRHHLDRALSALDSAEAVKILARSPIYETAPVGGPPDQPDYLNQAVRIETSLSPEGLLGLTQEIECDLGRSRTVPGGPRTVDIDILLYGDLIRSHPDPVLPHPRMHQRAFVLRPLADIAPDFVHPVFGKPVHGLLRRLRGIEPASSQPRLLER